MKTSNVVRANQGPESWRRSKKHHATMREAGSPVSSQESRRHRAPPCDEAHPWRTIDKGAYKGLGGTDHC